uniref:Uncharacterized protein n=1 Tax=Amphimedon queenslandica TaxID=400682 RepID=A0A1X7TQ22_AMPQE
MINVIRLSHVPFFVILRLLD